MHDTGTKLYQLIFNFKFFEISFLCTAKEYCLILTNANLNLKQS